jgi:hypothetical protein
MLSKFCCTTYTVFLGSIAAHCREKLKVVLPHR